MYAVLLYDDEPCAGELIGPHLSFEFAVQRANRRLEDGGVRRASVFRMIEVVAMDRDGEAEVK